MNAAASDVYKTRAEPDSGLGDRLTRHPSGYREPREADRKAIRGAWNKSPDRYWFRCGSDRCHASSMSIAAYWQLVGARPRALPAPRTSRSGL